MQSTTLEENASLADILKATPAYQTMKWGNQCQDRINPQYLLIRHMIAMQRDLAELRTIIEGLRAAEQQQAK